MVGRKLVNNMRQRSAAIEVRVASKVAAEVIEESWGENKNFWRINVGSKPRALSREEFMNRVGFQTVQRIGSVINGSIAYDSEASERATDEFDAISEDEIRVQNKGIRVAFRKVPDDLRVA